MSDVRIMGNMDPAFIEAVRAGLAKRDGKEPTQERILTMAKWLWTNTIIAVGGKRSVKMTENPHYLGRNIDTISDTICKGTK